MSRSKARGWFSGLCGLLLAAGALSAVPAAASEPTCGASQQPLTALGSLVDAQHLYRFQERPYVRLPLGVRLLVRAKPGVTAADLHRAASCTARADPRSPLSVAGSKLRVAQSGADYVLYVTAQDRTVAREIQRRAEGLE